MIKKGMLFCILALLLLPQAVMAGGQQDKAGTPAKVTFFWALYDGLTEEYRSSLQNAVNAAMPELQVDIVPVDWNVLHDKITTVIAGGSPPDISVVATRWLMEFIDMDAVEEITSYVGKDTLANISPGAMEAKIKGKMMGLPIVAGARILAINGDITNKIPVTMEELREEAIRVNDPPAVYGLIMPGKKYVELTDFTYYLYAAGGDMFEKKADGSYGKCTVNSPAGVKALEFMVQLATKDKVVQEGFLSLDRMSSHPIFYSGKVAYTFIGSWVESAYKQAGGTFDLKFATIPPFAGQKPAPLIITDSIAFFKRSKNKAAAGKVLDFFYQDKWKAKFDELVGFPPCTMTAAKLPQFQTPLYKTLVQSAQIAKGFPIMGEFAEVTSVIWDANVEAFLGQKTPKQALDDAAAKIDKLRGM